MLALRLLTELARRSAIGAWGQPMGQAVWTGSISFGLVSIPVKLYPATEPKDVRFHLYDRRTGKRLRCASASVVTTRAASNARPGIARRSRLFNARLCNAI